MRDLPISMQNNNTPTPKIQSQTNIQVIQDNTQTLQANSNIQNPTPILLQQKSKITTNPFISETQKKIELQAIQDNANKIMTDFYNKNSTSSIKNLSLSDINKNTSESILGLLDDLLKNGFVDLTPDTDYDELRFYLSGKAFIKPIKIQLGYTI